MKQFIYLVFAATLLACKKDGSGLGSQKMLFEKEFRNGLLETENIYNTDGKKVRANYYTAGGGTSTLSTYRLYNYDADGRLKEVFHFSKDHYATTREVYTYNANGQVSRIDEATVFTGDNDLDNMDYFEVFTYDGKGRLMQVVRRYTNHTLHSTGEYEYDNKGNMILYEGSIWENGGWVLKQKLVIEPGPNQMPEHWKKSMLLPTEDNLYEHYINKKTFTSYYGNPAGLTSVWTYPQRVYDSRGYLAEATYHFESGGTVSDTEFSFEYVQE